MNIDTIRHIQLLGFAVYMRDTGDSWVIYERDGKLGYYQSTDGGIINTVHAPNRETGTGFRVADHVGDRPSPEALEYGLLFAPNWATESYRASVKKFAGIEAFRKSCPWNMGYKLVER